MRLEDLRKRKSEDILYGFGLIALFLFIIAVILIKANLIELPITDCMFFQLTGFYCPGCGGTRALIALLHFQLIDSLIYHCFVTYVVICYLVFMVIHTVHLISRRKIKTITFHMRYVVIGIILLIAQLIIKNGLVLLFDYHLI